ncbi:MULTISPECIES: hypothetical protein [Pacificimonas]|uniref:Nutrient deprivation-induced protein n=1 Tax=Pacificimonas aurantium TaxID=1250540 RepID=A0ABS7WPW5_9SPHN|nr:MULTISPECIES: hypothetical protein [Pacificimonas]MBZ6379970.1 hypothetical protein [Pacificimonas aurantium]
MPTEDDKATSVDAVADTNVPGDAARTSASAPMSTTTHPTIAEHQDDGASLSARVPESVKDQANKLAGDAATRARSAAEEGKAKASETVRNLAASTRDAANQFKGTQAEPLTQYVNGAADSIEQFASTLDEKTVDELLDDLRVMVRKSPAIAIGAAAAVGFALSRFAKASERAFDATGGTTTPADRDA